MSRSFHQSHPAHVGKKARRPRPERKRKHRPYGLHSSKFNKEFAEKKGWLLDTQERWESSDISNKAKARREGKEDIQKELEEIDYDTQKDI